MTRTTVVACDRCKEDATAHHVDITGWITNRTAEEVRAPFGKSDEAQLCPSCFELLQVWLCVNPKE